MIRRLVVAVFAVLVVASPAAADGPVATARSTAQLTVSFRAVAESSIYRWDFGDGTTAEGAVVDHVYAQPGRYRATLTTDAGSTTVDAIAYKVTFGAPAHVLYGSRGRFTGSILPAAKGLRVDVVGPGGTIAHTRTGANGGFKIAARVRGVGPFQVRVAGITSDQASVRLRPRIDARLAGTRIVGQPLKLTARPLPASAGTVTAVVWRDGHRAFQGPVGSGLTLKTSRPSSFRVRLTVEPNDGYLAGKANLSAAVIRPVLVYGSRGPAVVALQQRLRELHYALPSVDGSYSLATYQAVLAFQAANGLPRTGGVNPQTWRRIVNAGVPKARYPGTHLEISKGRQVLYSVRNGHVQLVVHVSTGATGNTPLGHFHIYRKVVGWDWVLWYPMYFLRGFAVHGYPDVPSYPASHGCVRVPMWVAPRLFSSFFVGESVYLYW